MVEKIQSPSYFDKFKKSLVVIRKSFTFILQHKKLLFFPILTGSLIISTIGIYEGVYYQLYHKHITSFFPIAITPQQSITIQDDHAESEQSSEEYSAQISLEYILFALIITFASIFSFAFSNVGLSYATSQAFVGAPIKLGASLMHSLKKLPTLLVWTLSAFFIHMLIKFFKDEDGRSSFLGKLIGAAIELAWYIATFLVIPVMAHESSGAFASIKQSALLMKKTFGENAISALILGQIQGLLLLSLTGFTWGTFILTLHIGDAIGIRIPLAVLTSMMGSYVAIVGIIIAIASAATTVFKTAAYHYAMGNPTGPFDAAQMRSSFVTQAKK